MNTDNTNGITYPAGHVPVGLPGNTHSRLVPERRLNQRIKRLDRFSADNPNLVYWLSLYAQQQSNN